jgi:hypothetical protein
MRAQPDNMDDVNAWIALNEGVMLRPVAPATDGDNNYGSSAPPQQPPPPGMYAPQLRPFGNAYGSAPPPPAQFYYPATLPPPIHLQPSPQQQQYGYGWAPQDLAPPPQEHLQQQMFPQQRRQQQPLTTPQQQEQQQMQQMQLQLQQQQLQRQQQQQQHMSLQQAQQEHQQQHRRQYQQQQQQQQQHPQQQQQQQQRSQAQGRQPATAAQPSQSLKRQHRTPLAATAASADVEDDEEDDGVGALQARIRNLEAVNKRLLGDLADSFLAPGAAMRKRWEFVSSSLMAPGLADGKPGASRQGVGDSEGASALDQYEALFCVDRDAWARLRVNARGLADALRPSQLLQMLLWALLQDDDFYAQGGSMSAFWTMICEVLGTTPEQESQLVGMRELAQRLASELRAVSLDLDKVGDAAKANAEQAEMIRLKMIAIFTPRQQRLFVSHIESAAKVRESMLKTLSQVAGLRPNGPDAFPQPRSAGWLPDPGLPWPSELHDASLGGAAAKQAPSTRHG